MWTEGEQASLLQGGGPSWITDNRLSRMRRRKQGDETRAAQAIQRAASEMILTTQGATHRRKSTNLRTFTCGDIIALPSDRVWKVPTSDKLLRRLIQGSERNRSLITVAKKIGELKNNDIVMLPPIELAIDEYDNVDLEVDKRSARKSLNKMDASRSVRVGIGTISVTIRRRQEKGTVFQSINHSMTLLISNDEGRRIAYIVDSNGDAFKKSNRNWARRTIKSISKLLSNMNVVSETKTVDIPNVNFTPNESINKLLESYGLLTSREHGYCAVFSFLFVIEALCVSARSLLKGHFSRMIFFDLLRRKSLPNKKASLTDSEKVEIVMYARALALSVDAIVRPRGQRSYVTIERTHRDGIPELKYVIPEQATVVRRLRARKDDPSPSPNERTSRTATRTRRPKTKIKRRVAPRFSAKRAT